MILQVACAEDTVSSLLTKYIKGWAKQQWPSEYGHWACHEVQGSNLKKVRVGVRKDIKP